MLCNTGTLIPTVGTDLDGATSNAKVDQCQLLQPVRSSQHLQNSHSHDKKQYVLRSPGLLSQSPLLSSTAGLQKLSHEQLSLLQHKVCPWMTLILKNTHI